MTQRERQILQWIEADQMCIRDRSQAHGSITEKSLRPSNRAASCFFCCNALY